MTAAQPAAGADPGVAPAYDAVAGEYDRLVVEDLWMRRLLWRRYDAAFGPGERLLDLGCGTGQDALHLARRGLWVTALDLSPGMLNRARAAARAARLSDRIELRRADLGQPGQWPAGEWDGIISSFAALNTVDNLAAVAREAARRLRPRGRMILHLLAPRGLAAGVRRRALGAPGGGAEEHPVEIAGRTLRHRVVPAAEMYRRFFAADFELDAAWAVGFLWPRRWGRRLPLGLASRLGRLERPLGAWRPLLDRGRFYVLDLRKRSK